MSANGELAGRLFPSKFSDDSRHHIKYMLIAGRRADMDQDQLLTKATLSKNWDDIEYRTFDFITDNLKTYYAQEYAIPNSDSDEQRAQLEDYVELANPFYQSITNKDWKSFVASSDLRRTHMITQNMKAINEMLKPNETFEEFKKRY